MKYFEDEIFKKTEELLRIGDYEGCVFEDCNFFGQNFSYLSTSYRTTNRQMKIDNFLFRERDRQTDKQTNKQISYYFR